MVDKLLSHLSLSDWLVDRRHCKQQWQAASLIVREKINAALQDMPENEQLAKLLEGNCKFSWSVDILKLVYYPNVNSKI